MRNIIILLLLPILLFACEQNHEVEYVTVPQNLRSTTDLDIDSLIGATKYTAIVPFCDNCGATIESLGLWNKLSKEYDNLEVIVFLSSYFPNLIVTGIEVREFDLVVETEAYKELVKSNKVHLKNGAVLINNKKEILSILNPETRKGKRQYKKLLDN